MDSIANLLTDQERTRAYITGHTANIGDRKKNITLSEYRARTVVNYLQTRGVSSNQLSFDWKGPDLPLVSEGDISKNQRVEMSFGSTD